MDFLVMYFMKPFLFVIILFCVAKNGFAQKDEVKRYIIINSEKVDSAFLKSILQEIYSEAIKGNISAYNDHKFEKQLGIEEVKKVGEFCDTVQILQQEEGCNLIDSLVYTDADVEEIGSYSLRFEKHLTMPKSLLIELSRIYYPNVKDNDFWVNFSDLHKILDEKQISYLLNATAFLPSETVH